MKKNYFMLVCLVLLSAFSANAQAVSVADLFGDYKFTADVEFASEDYKNSYGNVIVSESDVTIGEDPYGIYDGAVFGFAGSSKALRFNFRNNTLEPMSIREVTLGSGLLFADLDANNPYGNASNAAYSPYYSYNPTTKEITIPDFTVVTVADEKNDEKGTLIATYKNAKLTYVGSNEPDTPAYDWTGTYTFNGTPLALDEEYKTVAADESLYPSTFEVVVKFMEATEYTDAMYVVTSFMGRDLSKINYEGGIKLTIESDGKSATLANGCVESLGGGNFLKLFDANAGANPIEITLNDDGSLSMANFSVVSGAYDSNTDNTMVCWYEDNTLAKGGAGTDTSAFSWVGQHTVKVGSVESYNGKTYPTEFTMTVIEDAGELLVTEFFSTDVTELNNGGIAFTVAADGKSAEMKSASFVGGAYPDYLVIYDMNAQENPIRFVLNDDGSVAIDNFCVKNYNFDTLEESLAALFKDVTIPAAGGSEPDVQESFDWAGTWEVSAETVTPYDGKEYASKFYMTIVFYPADEYNPAEYLVTQFLSNDVAGFNMGGIALSVAEDNSTAGMETGTLVGGAYPEYLKIYDMNATTSPVIFTANEDGTMSIADFFVKTLDYATNEESNAVFYQGITATKCPTGIENVEGENGMVKTIYDLQGRKVDNPTKGIYIINGKKTLIK